MSSINPLSAFLNKLHAFITELEKAYPAQAAQLREAKTMYSLARDANPKLIHRLYVEEVANKYEAQIMARDEAFIRVSVEQHIKTDFPAFYDMIGPCLALWDTMSETERDVMWKHCQVILVLARRVPVN